MAEPLVVVVGDVINDVIVVPTGPAATGTDTPAKIEFSPGGSGANQAAWLASLGTRVRFVARVGGHDIEAHRAALGQFGVEALLASDGDRPTGSIVVLVSPDGERSMFTDRGANVGLRAADLPPSVLDGAGLLQISGYQLFEPETRRAVCDLWATARENAIATSVDPASVAGLREVGPAAFLDWTSGASLAFPNLDEGRLLSGQSEPDAIVTALLDSYEVVVLKLGPAGALVGSLQGDRIRVDARQTRIVDSTGAGDAFCAGFLSSWLRGKNLRRCVREGVAVAELAVGQVGARPRAVDDLGA